jgi:hypothetical protein
MPSGRFNNVELPPGLSVAAIRKAIDYIEQELSDLVELYFEQANVFSALVGIYGAKALASYSVYEKSKHTDIAQQRFPDLQRRGSGSRPSPRESLESKASKRPWALQSHYNHSGWYIVWRYLVDPAKMIDTKRSVIIWRVDIVFLKKEDWKYEGSGAQEGKGGRTHTFGLKNPAERLKGKAVYEREDVRILGGKVVLKNGT